MNTLRCALVQTNVVVGALAANGHKVALKARLAAAQGAQLIVFPELTLSGYPPEDLVLKRHFLEDCREELAKAAAACPPEVVVVVGVPILHGEHAANAAAVLAGGRVQGYYRKRLLPNYGVFDEKRVFEAGDRPGLLDLGPWRIGLHICEDSWFPAQSACQGLRAAGVDAVINLSASPYHRGKLAQRQAMLGEAARAMGAPLLYANLIGGQDELVFDGTSLVLDAGGACVARARSFVEDLLLWDLPEPARRPAVSQDGKDPAADLPAVGRHRAEADLIVLDAPAAHSPRVPVAPRVEIEPDDLAGVYAALRLGLRDYVDKNGFSHVIVAISGGIDSALVATLAVDALGPERVYGITLPSRYSSGETRGDAHELARRLGITLKELPIQGLFQSYLDELRPLWPGRHPDTTEENLQARIRGNIVMALSNKFGWLVLTTGNKSEMATGYCTLYGDMAGGFAVIKDVPKTLVFALARWRNAQVGTDPAEPIPVSTLDRPPTAELRDNQKDSDSLPPYEVLDPIIERYVERDWGVDRIVEEGFEARTVRQVIRLVDRNEYKRRQGAPGVKITPKAFGRDRRLPITNDYSERIRPPAEAAT